MTLILCKNQESFGLIHVLTFGAIVVLTYHFNLEIMLILSSIYFEGCLVGLVSDTILIELPTHHDCTIHKVFHHINKAWCKRMFIDFVEENVVLSSNLHMLVTLHEEDSSICRDRVIVGPLKTVTNFIRI